MMTKSRYWVLVYKKRYCAFDSKSEAKLCIKFFIEDRLVDGSALEIEEEQMETVGGCLYER